MNKEEKGKSGFLKTNYLSFQTWGEREGREVKNKQTKKAWFTGTKL